MPDDGDLTGKVSLDTTAFKTGVSELTNQIKSIETNFRASAAVMDNWSSDTNGLTDRISSLNEKLDLEKQKLNLLHDEYNKVVSEQGASSKAAESLANQMYAEQKKIESTKSEIGKYENKLQEVNSTTDSTKNETKGFGDSLDKAGKHAISFGDILKANVISGVILDGFRSLVSGFKDIASSVMDSADSLVQLSDKTGLSTEKLQELQYIGDDLGVDLDTMASAQDKLTKSMNAAKEGTGSQADAFKALGISVTDANGNLRDAKDVMNEAYGALGGVANETERDALAMSIFGKSATDLNPLIKAGSDQLNALSEQAKASGAVMSDETVTALDSLGDSVDHMKQSVKGAVGTFAADFAPSIQNVSDSLAGMMGGTVTVDQFAKTVGDAAKQIVTKLTESMPAILQMGSSILLALIQGLVSALPQIAASAISIITQLAMSLVAMLPQIISVGLDVLIALIQGLTEAIPQLIEMLPTIIKSIVDTLLAHLPEILQCAIQLLVALIQGLAEALPQLIEMLPTIITTIVDVLIDNLPLILDAAWQIIMALSQGLIQSLPDLIMMIPDICAGIKTSLANFDWGALGKNMIDGIKNGVVKSAGNLVKAAKETAERAIKGVKDWLGIRSPSKRFETEVGVQMIAGAEKGVAGRTKSFVASLKGSMQQAVDGVSGIAIPLGIAGSYSATGARGGQSSQTNQIINNNQFGAQQQVTVLEVGAEKIATVVTPTVSSGVSLMASRRRAAYGY